MPDYDIITVGGGIGGAAIAKAMAENGKRVLVIEREKRFKDRVRGEWMAPWGVAETQALGLYDALVAGGGVPSPRIAARAGPAELPVRDLTTESAIGLPCFAMYHPAMQETVLQAAAGAGADVTRGARVTNVTPGPEPTVTYEGEDGTRRASAKLVVGADGRNSVVRKWGGFESTEEDKGNMLAGVLLENVNCENGLSNAIFNPFLGQIAFLFMQDGGRGRAYFGYRTDSGMRLQGDADTAILMEKCVQTGAPASWYENATQAGPVASFAGVDSWVEHPYKDGIALVGDAAQTSDQTWGQGLSITFRDARLLRDALLENEDWEAAGHAYADAANECFQHIKRVEDWQTLVMMEQGPEANATRMKVLPRLATDPTILPDTLFCGPELAPADEAARVHLFGE
jgi:2-polyprenyl-6-methoxyphenol hydroxylase-like FAD-dependent oxidoreductase